MFVILKRDNRPEELILNRNIFPRPTPWKVSWEASFSYLLRRQTYCFVYFPPQFTDIFHYEIDVEEGDLVLRKEDKEVYRTVVCKMSLQLWILYEVESVIYGPLFRFWNWRWSAGKLTTEELQAKVEALEKRMDCLQKKTRRIEQEED